MNWLGLDIGGANLKVANGLGWARSVPFALWRNPSGLASALESLIEAAPSADGLAITMTGELCDCFPTKAEGVRHILAAAERAAGKRAILVYLVDGRFSPTAEVGVSPCLAAASNWHALARFAGRYARNGTALLVDVGSTTTDVVPLVGGRPNTTSRTDTERLVAGELVYTGVGRTPICAVTRTLPWRGQQCAVAAELFATTADAYVLRGDLPEVLSADWTADGRPLTKKFAVERMARMVCADTTTFGITDAMEAAEWVRAAQVSQLLAAVDRVTRSTARSPETVVTSGSGEFLARAVAPVGRNVISLEADLGPEVSRAATAHAVAILAMEFNCGNAGQ